jgi:hypothetical protein
MTLRSRIDAASPDAPVVVLFGGHPVRRHEVVTLLGRDGRSTVIGALSEAEGMELLRTLPRVDVVLIGGRYGEAERVRIRAFVREHLPWTQLSEPGFEFPYAEDAIVADVRRKIAASRSRPSA